jgi:hypothetical protein
MDEPAAKRLRPTGSAALETVQANSTAALLSALAPATPPPAAPTPSRRELLRGVQSLAASASGPLHGTRGLVAWRVMHTFEDFLSVHLVPPHSWLRFFFRFMFAEQPAC